MGLVLGLVVLRLVVLELVVLRLVVLGLVVLRLMVVAAASASAAVASPSSAAAVASTLVGRAGAGGHGYTVGTLVGCDAVSWLATREAQVVVESVVPFLLTDAGDSVVDDAIEVHRVDGLMLCVWSS